MVRLRLSISGVQDLLDVYANPDELIADLDRVVERHARLIANQAAENAPVKTGRLRSSIPASVEKERDMSWTLGSDVVYATRQEYEHSTKRAFLRRALWDGEQPFNEEMRNTVRNYTEQ